MLPFEREVYERFLDSMTAFCLNVVTHNRASRAEYVERWYRDAEIARANKQPLPPQPNPPLPEPRVTVVPGSLDQNTISIVFDPVPVPPPLVLPEIPNYLLGKYPPNVTAISGITSDGSILTCFPEDTRPTGHREIYQGKVGIKVERLGYGNLRVSFYRVIEAIQ